MITEIEMANYKSIDKLTLPLGRVNVFIGENGAGKSNILEVIALAAAAAAGKLDNEFLSSRGIRVTRPEHMRPAFPGALASAPVSISFKNDQGETGSLELNNENVPYSKWTSKTDKIADIKLTPAFLGLLREQSSDVQKAVIELFEAEANRQSQKLRQKIYPISSSTPPKTLRCAPLREKGKSNRSGSMAKAY